MGCLIGVGEVGNVNLIVAVRAKIAVNIKWCCC